MIISQTMCLENQVYSNLDFYIRMMVRLLLQNLIHILQSDQTSSSSYDSFDEISASRMSRETRKISSLFIFANNLIENYHLAESSPAYDIFLVCHSEQIPILIWEFYIDGTLISYFWFG